MKKIKIVFGDLSYYTSLTEGNRYVPLGIGYLATYLTSIYGEDVEIKIFKEPNLLLEYISQEKPDLIGFSHYYWNTELNRLVIKKIRNKYNNSIKIALGGPSIDSDPETLLQTALDLGEVDFFVPDEGELGFANIVEAMFAGTIENKEKIDGVAFEEQGKLQMGANIGLSTDLSSIGSPYLNGFMDEFMTGDYLPMIQTSRLCPYSCAFCVSGKNVGKLRSFPIEQVKAEIDYIAQKYKDYPNHMLYIIDENFGILDRDVEIAQYIQDSSESSGYPQKLFYYNDKKFGKSSRDVHDIVGHMCFHGLCLSLQTENPEALKAIKRTNMSLEKINEAMAWGRSKDLPLSTELIFGLPLETRESFLNLIDKCNEMKFDSIVCYNLIIFDGIELNRASARERFELETKYRHLCGSYTFLEDEFCAEAEEIVVGADGFDMSDFKFIRYLNALLYCTSFLRMHTLFFAYIKELKIPFSKFVLEMFNMEKAKAENKEWYEFVNNLNTAIDSELFDTKEELFNHLREEAERNGKEIPNEIKINPEFGSIMLQNSGSWIALLLRQTLERLLPENSENTEFLETAKFLLEVGGRERATIDNFFSDDTMQTEYDIVSWRREGFKSKLETYKIPTSTMKFTSSSALVEDLKFLSQDYKGKELQLKLYERLLQFKIFTADLLYEIHIEENR